MSRFLIPTLLLLFSTQLFGGEPSPLGNSEVSWGDWQEARALYDGGKFDEAAKSLVAHPAETAAFYFNLGTVYYRLGRLGNGVAYLEKSNHLMPHDPSIRQNLKLAREGLAKTIGAEKLDPASTWSETLADRISLEEVRATLGLFGCVLALLWIRFYLPSRDLKRTLLQPAALCCLIAFIITASLYAAERTAEDRPAAVVLEPQTIRSGPGDQYLDLGRVEAGTKIRALGPVGTEAGGVPWKQVRYSQEGIGWVRSSSLLLL